MWSFSILSLMHSIALLQSFPAELSIQLFMRMLPNFSNQSIFLVFHVRILRLRISELCLVKCITYDGRRA